MSSNVETQEFRVEAQYDGKDFEKGIRKSQKSLEDFKKEMDFDSVANGFSQIFSKLDELNNTISGMAKNTAKMASEMTGFGRVSTYIAKKVQNAWHKAADSVERFTRSMTTAQISEGKNKYDLLLKSVQTIKNATGESEEAVYSVMGDLNKYTDETSYSFSEMASNIGKFTTAGIGLKDAEEEMEGIANWAALAGQGVNEANRAMYNISQAMSAGYMQKIDYKSIQNANMDIRAFRKEALEAAVAAGTLKKSKDGVYKTVKGGKQVNLDNFVETLKYKWFDKKTMELTFKTFADNTKGIGEQAYKAAQRCTTLTDVIKAWKDMLSTGWMKTYEHVFGKLSDAMALFSGLCNKVGEDLKKLVDIRNKVLGGWNLSGGRNAIWGALFGELETPDDETLFKGAYGILDAMREIGDAIREAFWDFVEEFIPEEHRSIFEADKDAEGPKVIGSMLAELSRKVQEFTGRIHNFLHETEDGGTETRLDRIKNIFKAIYAAILLVVNIIRGAIQFTSELTKQARPGIQALEKLVNYFVQLFTGKVVQGAKKNTIGNFFHSLAELLRPVSNIINKVVQAIVSLIIRFTETLRTSGVLDYIRSLAAEGKKIFSGWMEKIANSGVIEKIFQWIAAAISKIPGLIENIKAFGKSISEAARKANALGKLKGLFQRIFGGKNIKDVLVSLKKNISETIKKIPEILTSVKGSGIWGSISGFFRGIFNSLFGVGEADAEGSDDASEAISTAISKPIEKLGTGDILGKAFDKAKPGLLANLKTKISEMWGSIKTFFANIGNSEGLKSLKKFFAGTDFKYLLDSAKDILKWLAIFRGGSGLVSMGKGIKSMGKGFKVFGKNLKDLNLSNLFNIKTMINSGNTDNSRTNNWGNFANGILKLAGSVAILVAALATLGKMKPEELKQGGLALAAVVLALIGAGWAAKKWTGNGRSLLALSVGVLLLLVPLKALVKMPWGTLLDGVAKLAVIVGVLALAMRISKSAKVKGFATLALAVNLLLIPIKVLSKMPLLGEGGKFGGLVQGFSALTAILLVIAGAARLIGDKKPKGIMGIAVALTILLIPIKQIGNMDLEKAAVGVGAVLLIIIAITAMIKIIGDNEVTGLYKVVAAITALAAVGAAIALAFDWKQALVGFVPIIAILAFMAIMFKAASKLEEKQMKYLAIIMGEFVVMVLAIAAAIITMSQLKVGWELAAVFMGGLILLIAAMGVMVKLTAKTKPERLSKLTILMGVFAAIIAVVCAAVIFISEYKVDWTVIASFFGGLVLLLVAMGVMVKLVAKTKPERISKVVLVLLAFSLVIAAAGAALVFLAKEKIDWTVIAAFMVGLTALIVALGFILPILGKMNVKAVIIGIVALAAAIAAILGVVAVMVPIIIGSVGGAMTTMASRLKVMSDLLKDFFERMNKIDDGSVQHALDVFDKLKELILKFTGFSGLDKDLHSAMSSLIYLASGLNAFFMNDVNIPDVESSNSVKALNKFVELAPSFATINFGDAPTQLMYLGVGLMLFDEATKDIVSANPIALQLLEGIFGQTANITAFANLPIEQFVGQMSALGGAMSLYAKGAMAVTGLSDTEDEIPDISHSVEILKAVCAAISGEDDGNPFKIPDNMPDDVKLGVFAGQLEALGTALSTFAGAAQKMETNTSKALALLRFLAKIGGYLTEDNLAVVDVFDKAELGHATDEKGTGSKLGQFALDIGALGTALSKFASNIGGNESAFSTGLSVVERFGELNTKLTADSLQFAKAFDDASVHKSQLTQLATDIALLGYCLKVFAESVQLENGQQADFNNALGALDFMVTLQNRLPIVGGLYSIIHGANESLGKVALEIEALGTALKDFSEKMAGTEETGAFNLGPVNDALEALAKMVQILGVLNSSINGKEDGWADDYGTLLISFVDFLATLDEVDNELLRRRTGTEGQTIFDQVALMAQKISMAFKKVGGIDAQAISMFKDIATAVSYLITMDPSTNFKQPGLMIAQGLETGIREGKSLVVDAVVEIVQAAIDAGNVTAKIKSPSKVFTEMGEYMDAGLVKGLLGDKDKVENASGEMTESAINSTAEMMALISQAMADDLDLRPTITPVLDLSNVTSAGSVLGGLFNGYALDLSTALDRAAQSSGVGGPAEVIVQNPTDLGGIGETINGLRADIAALREDMVKMKVVLNTGAIAGGVTNDVDINLGLKNLYASRRN